MLHDLRLSGMTIVSIGVAILRWRAEKGVFKSVHKFLSLADVGEVGIVNRDDMI